MAEPGLSGACACPPADPASAYPAEHRLAAAP